MSTVGDAIDLALLQLNAAVAEGLRGQGWDRLDLGFPPVAVLTRPTVDGLWATTTLSQFSFKWPAAWPVDLSLRFGAGYSPATALMPILTLSPTATLLHEPSPDEGPTLELSGPDEVARTATRIVELVSRHGTGFAETFHSVQSLDAALSKEDDPAGRHVVTMRATLLASSGQLEAARRLIDEQPAPSPAGRAGRGYHRFARQLRRWLDAGGPAVPALEESIGWLVPLAPERPKRQSWADSRKTGEEKRAAAEAVRAIAKGRSREAIGELLTTEYAARGLEASPAEILVAAEMVELDQRPFRRGRRAFRAVQLFGAVGGAGVRHMRHGTEPDPEWMAPPETATYPVGTAGRYAEVLLSDGAPAWLNRVAAQSPRRVGPLVPVDLWLTGSDELVVHLGDEPVGTLAAEAAQEFVRDLKAAQFFAEQARVPGRLTVGPGGALPLLEIALPARHASET